MLLASLDGPSFDILWDLARAGLWAVVAWLVYRLGRWWRDRAAERERRARSIPIDAWRERGLGVKPREEVVVQVGEDQRCPLCHAAHEPATAGARCDACGAVLHVDCAREHGRCTTLGCGGALRRVDALVRAPA